MTTRRGPTRTLTAVVLGISLLAAACGDDESGTASSTSTTPPSSTSAGPTTSTTPTTDASSTTAPATIPGLTDLESLSYLEQRLLTTQEIGNGWIDQGRHLVPPQQQSLRAGGLCAEGESTLATVGTRLNDLVMTTYRKDEQPATASMAESLLWGPRDQVIADFATFKAAHDACIGGVYVTPNGDSQRLDALEVPALGTDQVATHLSPGEPITDNPWMEVDAVVILLSDPAVDVAVVVTVLYLTVHEPGGEAIAPDVDELIRVARLAVEKNISPP